MQMLFSRLNQPARRSVIVLAAAILSACASISPQSPALLQKQVSQLQAASRPAVYLISVAAWSEPELFSNEMNAVKDYFANRYGTAERTILFSNARSDEATLPQVDKVQLQAAIQGIAAKMDKEQDILALYMVSHGVQNGDLKVKYPSSNSLNTIDARWLKTELDLAGIKWRMVFVSSCFSGVFADVLANDNSLIVTAADANNPSLGCSDRFKYTVFGKALIVDNFYTIADREDWSTQFERAKLQIEEQEIEYKFPPGHPQFRMGFALQTKLNTMPVH